MKFEEVVSARLANQKAWPETRWVLCHGCWDLLHLGHVRHLEAAKAFGDILVVTVTPDKFVNKGPARPVFNENDRAEMLVALRCVDYVAINLWPTAAETIKQLRPNIYCKGSDTLRDWKEHPAETDAVNSVGGKMVFTETPAMHTTDILEKLRSADAFVYQG